MHDAMYYETQVENEEFESALLWYVLNKDPEIQKKMQEYMSKMQTEMEAGAPQWATWEPNQTHWNLRVSEAENLDKNQIKHFSIMKEKIWTRSIEVQRRSLEHE